MRNLHELDHYRARKAAREIYGSEGDGTCGLFVIPSPIDGQALRMIASSEDGWDHVSVSRANRCPNWPEMEFIRRKFFMDNETVMQLHVPASEHINFARNCLHLWKPQRAEIPRPPSWMVGPQMKSDE